MIDDRRAAALGLLGETPGEAGLATLMHHLNAAGLVSGLRAWTELESGVLAVEGRATDSGRQGG